MPKTVFIGDLHLSARFPSALSAFLDYLQTLAKQQSHSKDERVDALYILGDLFDYWLGDDCLDACARDVAKGLAHYRQQTGVPVYFTHGNRDFLLGKDYADKCLMQLLPETHVVDLYGVKTLVLHGDTLCADDVAYQRFRRIVRCEHWQKKMLRRPRWVRQLIAKYLRLRSMYANQRKSAVITNVTQRSVTETMQQNNVTHMIHGHTHRPAIHRFSFNNQTATRSVVGDWYQQGSVLIVEPNNRELITLPFQQ